MTTLSLSLIRKYWARCNEQAPSNEANLVSTNDRPNNNDNNKRKCRCNNASYNSKRIKI